MVRNGRKTSQAASATGRQKYHRGHGQDCAKTCHLRKRAPKVPENPVVAALKNSFNLIWVGGVRRLDESRN